MSSHGHGDLWETMKAAAAATQGPHPMEWANIATYDPKTHTATVYFLSGDPDVHGPYYLFTPWVGQGWGMQVGPLGGGLDGNGNPQGEPCVVIFPDPDQQLGFILLGHFSDLDAPPGAPAGELWMVHKQGATLKLTGDGNIQLTGAKVLLGDATAADPAAKGNETQARLAAIESKLSSVCTTLTAATGGFVPGVGVFIADTSNIKSSKVFISS